MWIFHEAISRIRTHYNLVVKIEHHKDVLVSGRAEGRVVAEPNPMRHPIPLAVSPNVPVSYINRDPNQRGQQVVESMPVAALGRTPNVKYKGTHVIIKGERIGTLVTHLRTEREYIRVFETGGSRAASFNVDKINLCIVEPNNPCVCIRSVTSLMY